ncbi:MAG: hypothetical protein ACKOC5_16475 [Chloroflexota bacterium]
MVKKALLLLCVGLAIWIPRAFGLNRYVLTDEVVWLWRSANFYYGLGQRDFTIASRNMSPGVVTMWANTAAFLVRFPEYRGYGQGLLDKYSLMESFLLEHDVNPHDLLTTGRALTAALNSGLLALACLLAYRLFGLLPALAGFLLIAFEPYYIGLTRLSHLDGPMSAFAIVALLAFLVYLYDGQRLAPLLLSAAAAALSILAKLPGLILLPTFALLWLWEAMRAGSAGRRQPLLRPALLWAGAFLLTMLVFFPALWANPRITISNLVVGPLRLAGNVFTLKPDRPADTARSNGAQTDDDNLDDKEIGPFEYILRYPTRYISHATPITLIGLLAGLLALLLSSGPFQSTLSRRAAIGVLVFVAVYTVLMTIPPKSSGKYYAPAYPSLDIIAGLGWAALAGWAQQGLRWLNTAGQAWAGRLSKAAAALILSAAVLIQALQALPEHPYYLTYLNPGFCSTQELCQQWSSGSGEGLDQAAAYLNGKPNAGQLKVMSLYGIGPFSYFFKGQTTPLILSSSLSEAMQLRKIDGMDYLVVYLNHWKRQRPVLLFSHLNELNLEPEQRIYLDGVEYARIYAVSQFPPGLFDTPSP